MLHTVQAASIDISLLYSRSQFLYKLRKKSSCIYDLYKSSLCICNTSVKLSVSVAIFLGSNPPDLAFQLVFLNQRMHLFYLTDFFPVLRFCWVKEPSYYDKVNQIPQPFVLCIPLCQTCDVLYYVEPCHGKYDGLLLVTKISTVWFNMIAIFVRATLQFLDGIWLVVSAFLCKESTHFDLHLEKLC